MHNEVSYDANAMQIGKEILHQLKNTGLEYALTSLLEPYVGPDAARLIANGIVSALDMALNSRNNAVSDKLGVNSSYTPYNPNKPIQTHHIATNKNPDYTPGFSEIAGKYGLDLDGDWNKVDLPHQGTHPWEYHDFIEDMMYKIDELASGNVDIFTTKWRELGELLKENPQMLYGEFWRS